ncbi:hypothetical protein ACMGE7_11150 [Macrococcus equi]|uniref:hypothetical protein n=1 Tax=Macrococcus equi TaxID=3395462 RepID=UPI0039BE9B86
MTLQMKQLVVMVLGFVEIIAGLSLYEKSPIGSLTFILLGLAFLAIMFILQRKDSQKHYYIRKR